MYQEETMSHFVVPSLEEDLTALGLMKMTESKESSATDVEDAMLGANANDDGFDEDFDDFDEDDVFDEDEDDDEDDAFDEDDDFDEDDELDEDALTDEEEAFAEAIDFDEEDFFNGLVHDEKLSEDEYVAAVEALADAEDADLVEFFMRAGDSLDEAELVERRVRRRMSGRKVIKLKRSTAKEKLRARKSYRKRKGKIKRARKRKMKSSKYRRHLQRMTALAVKKGTRSEANESHDAYDAYEALSESRTSGPDSLSRIAALVEDVEGLLQGVRKSDNTEVVESFNNIREISEMLSQAFAFFAEEDDSDELAELSEGMKILRDAAIRCSAGLMEDEFDVQDVEESYKKQMAALLDAVEIYESIVEGND
jgi:hypothetical protein